MPQTPIYERIKNATVAITSLWLDRKDQPFTIIGSGVCVDPSGLIVTCAHVIEAFMSKSLASQIAEMNPEKDNRGAQRGPEIKVARAHAMFFRSDISKTQLFAFPCPVDLIVAEKHFDLAVLRVAQRNAFKTGYPTAEIEDYDSIQEGADIATCGFPLGEFLYQQLGTVTSSFTKGIISSIIPAANAPVSLVQGFQLNLTATHGNSGGPVFSLQSGKVFGILARGVFDSSGTHLLPGIVKAEPIYPVLNTQLLQSMKKAKPGEIPLPQE